MRGEQHHQCPFGELDQRLLGPGEECVKLQGVAERPEMNRQEQRERNARQAVDKEHPVRRMPIHAKTAKTARIPIQARSAAKATSAMRSEEHTSELQSQSNLVCRLLLGKKNI